MRNQPPAHFEYYQIYSKEKLTILGWSQWKRRNSGENVTCSTYLAMIDNFVVPNMEGRFEERNNGRRGRGCMVGTRWCPSASSETRDSVTEQALWKPDTVARVRVRMATTISSYYPIKFFLAGMHQRPSVRNTCS